jgi:hypothetical protein
MLGNNGLPGNETTVDVEANLLFDFCRGHPLGVCRTFLLLINYLYVYKVPMHLPDASYVTFTTAIIGLLRLLFETFRPSKKTLTFNFIK